MGENPRPNRDNPDDEKKIANSLGEKGSANEKLQTKFNCIDNRQTNQIF